MILLPDTLTPCRNHGKQDTRGDNNTTMATITNTPFCAEVDCHITFLQPMAALSGHLEHLAFSSAEGPLLLQPGLSRQIRLEFQNKGSLCLLLLVGTCSGTF